MDMLLDKILSVLNLLFLFVFLSTPLKPCHFKFYSFVLKTDILECPCGQAWIELLFNIVEFDLFLACEVDSAKYCCIHFDSVVLCSFSYTKNCNILFCDNSFYRKLWIKCFLSGIVAFLLTLWLRPEMKKGSIDGAVHPQYAQKETCFLPDQWGSQTDTQIFNWCNLLCGFTLEKKVYIFKASSYSASKCMFSVTTWGVGIDMHRHF